MKYLRNSARSTAMGKLFLMILAVILLLAITGCGPEAKRGGPGTDNPELDDPAMSLKLDRRDVEYLVSTNTRALSNSPLWLRAIAASEKPPLVSIWPIYNATSQHIDDQMDALLGSIETFLVNSGEVGVVSREKQHELIQELHYRQSDVYDPETAGRIGRQLGAQYFVTGKISSVEERLQDTRRVQYSLILQVIEVETGLIKFQKEAIRSKSIER